MRMSYLSHVDPQGADAPVQPLQPQVAAADADRAESSARRCRQQVLEQTARSQGEAREESRAAWVIHLLRWLMGDEDAQKDKDRRPPLTRAEIEAILRIEREHAALLLRLKQAILAGDTMLEHQLAREVVGLPKEVTQ